MFTGKKFWRQFTREQRVEAMKDALRAFRSSHPGNRIFACIIDKSKASPRDSVELAFEQLASRFDHYLMRLHKRGDTQRGVIIFDKSTYETTIQNLATDFVRLVIPGAYSETWPKCRFSWIHAPPG